MAGGAVTRFTDDLWSRFPEQTREFDDALGRPQYRWLELLGHQGDELRAIVERIAYDPDSGGTSELIDPDHAAPEWARWQRQLYSYGPYAGTTLGLQQAAAQHLTGSKYLRVTKNYDDDEWAIGVLTRTSETPDDFGDVLNDPAVKPAGYTIVHTTYEAPWDTVETEYPTWDALDAATWDQIEETGAPDG